MHEYLAFEWKTLCYADKGTYACGSGQNGRLGLGSQADASRFVLVDGLEGINICQLECGLDHTRLIKG